MLADALLFYMSLIGGVFDEATQLYRITPAKYENLESMFFTINDVRIIIQYACTMTDFASTLQVDFEFTANAQIWPVRPSVHYDAAGNDLHKHMISQRELNNLIGGSSEFVYLIIADIGTFSGSGMDIVNGMMFTERFYAVFDTANNRVGIANTRFTDNTGN